MIVSNNSHTIRPDRLSKGDKVALITPGSPITLAQYRKAKANIESIGLVPVDGKYVHEHNGFIAGDDQQRLLDLHWAFETKEIKAVWCVRGGYGCARLLPLLDFDLIKKNPKIFIGYSDVTVLLNAITQRTGIITYHGPIGAHQFIPKVVENIKAVLFDNTKEVTLSIAKPFLEEKDEGFFDKVIHEGSVTGELAGGNLALVHSVMGTPYEIDFKDKLVFLEDIHEKPYALDRMFTNLLLGNKFNDAKGIALGVFADCQPKPTDDSISLEEMIEDRMSSLSCPSLYGLAFGHIHDNMILPIGEQATLDTFEKELVISF